MTDKESTFDKNVKELKANIDSYKKTMDAKNEQLTEAINEMRANLGFSNTKEQPLEVKSASYSYSLESVVEKKRRELGFI
jgi:hypothetical protein